MPPQVNVARPRRNGLGAGGVAAAWQAAQAVAGANLGRQQQRGRRGAGAQAPVQQGAAAPAQQGEAAPVQQGAAAPVQQGAAAPVQQGAAAPPLAGNNGQAAHLAGQQEVRAAGQVAAPPPPAGGPGPTLQTQAWVQRVTEACRRGTPPYYTGSQPGGGADECDTPDRLKSRIRLFLQSAGPAPLDFPRWDIMRIFFQGPALEVFNDWAVNEQRLGELSIDEIVDVVARLCGRTEVDEVTALRAFNTTTQAANEDVNAYARRFRAALGRLKVQVLPVHAAATFVANLRQSVQSYMSGVPRTVDEAVAMAQTAERRMPRSLLGGAHLNALPVLPPQPPAELRRTGSGGPVPFRGRCYNCQQYGHRQAECPQHQAPGFKMPRMAGAKRKRGPTRPSSKIGKRARDVLNVLAEAFGVGGSDADEEGDGSDDDDDDDGDGGGGGGGGAATTFDVDDGSQGEAGASGSRRFSATARANVAARVKQLVGKRAKKGSGRS